MPDAARSTPSANRVTKVSEVPNPTKYRKLPVEIVALRFVMTPKSGRYLAGTNLVDVVEWIEQGGGDTIVRPPGGIGIKTLEGVMWAAPGDYIIRGVKGEFYPCKGEIFDATYERCSS